MVVAGVLAWSLAAAGPVVELPEVEVSGRMPHPLDGMGGDGLRPGVGIWVPATALEGRQIESAADWLVGLPGVYVADAFGGNDLPKLSLRGSDLAAFPTKKGVLLLRDDLPMNQADGSLILAVVGTEARGAEVTLGHPPGALVLPTLGGTINFLSPTGLSAPGGSLGLSVGSQGRRGAQVALGGERDGVDTRVQAGWRQSDGYRQHHAQSGSWLEANAGIRLGEEWRARAYLQLSRFAFEVPGAVSAGLAAADPRAVSPGFIPGVHLGADTLRDRPRRDGDYLRFGVRLGRQDPAGGGTVVGLQGSWLDDAFVRPIALGIEDSRYANVAASLLHGWRLKLAVPVRLQVSGVLIHGKRDAVWHHNDGGERGPEFARFRMEATTLALGLSGALDLATGTTLEAGLVAAGADRVIRERFGDPARRPGFGGPPPPPAPPAFWGEAVNGAWWHDALLPTLAVTHRLGAGIELQAKAYRTWEAPVFDDLLEFSGGTPNRGPVALSVHPLRPQRAGTLEAGVRIRQAGHQVAISGYATRLRDEILTLSDGGTQRRSLNAERTRHHGIEASWQWDQPLGGSSEGAAPPFMLTFRSMVEGTDYRFEDHPLYGRNRLPGVPAWRARSAWTLRHQRGLFATVEGEWRSHRTHIDFANSAWISNVALAHLQVGGRVGQGVSWFVEVRNLLDTRHVSTSIIVDRVAAPIAATVFPGEGRSLRAGLQWRW